MNNDNCNGFDDLLAQMLAFVPNLRRTCVELLKHPFFSNYMPSKVLEGLLFKYYSLLSFFFHLFYSFRSFFLEWTSKANPFSDKHLDSFVEKCGGDLSY